MPTQRRCTAYSDPDSDRESDQVLGTFSAIAEHLVRLVVVCDVAKVHSNLQFSAENRHLEVCRKAYEVQY